jgi:hypothetical protein
MQSKAHKDRREMTKKKTIDKDCINLAAHLLTLAAHQETEDVRKAKQEAVQQLVGPILSARQTGLNFESIAQILQHAGLEIEPSTLRNYFFKAKTVAEVAESAKLHAKRVEDTRRKLLVETSTARNEVARVAAAGVTAKHNQRPRSGQANKDAMAAFLNERQNKDQDRRTADQKRVLDTVTKPEVAAQESPRPPSAVAERPPRSEARGLAEAAQQLGEPTGQPHSIESIAQRSEGHEDRVQLDADLVLIDDCVFSEGDSKEPYCGCLSRKQLHMLRTNKRLVAPKESRTSGDFLKLRREL